MDTSMNRIDQTIVIASDETDCRRVEDLIVDAAERCHFASEEVCEIRLAVREALVNAVIHGNRRGADKKIRIDFAVDTVSMFVSIEDEGPGFEPEHVPDPTAPECRERFHGRGLKIMRRFMSKVRFCGKGSRVEMWKMRE